MSLDDGVKPIPDAPEEARSRAGALVGSESDSSAGTEPGEPRAGPAGSDGGLATNEEGRETGRVPQVGDPEWDQRCEQPFEGGLSIEWSTKERHFWIVRQTESGSGDFVDDRACFCFEPGVGGERVSGWLRTHAEVRRSTSGQPGIRYKAVEVDPHAPKEQHPAVRFAAHAPAAGVRPCEASDGVGSRPQGILMVWRLGPGKEAEADGADREAQGRAEDVDGDARPCDWEGRAFSDILEQIPDAAERAQLREMVEKYTALKRLLDAGEQLESLRLRLRALGGGQVANGYESDPLLAIMELERWREWKANDWPKWQQEREDLRAALGEATARIEEVEGAVGTRTGLDEGDEGTAEAADVDRADNSNGGEAPLGPLHRDAGGPRLPSNTRSEPERVEPKLARCKQCEHVFLRAIAGDSPITCELCGANVAWQFAMPGGPRGAHAPPSRPNIDVGQLRFFTGRSFEQFLKILFQSIGFGVEETPATGDQGADLILTDPSHRRIAVQAKRYNQDVGNGAVQEILGGMKYWECCSGIVVSASGFTKAARDLASKAPEVALWDKPVLEALIDHYMSDLAIFIAERQPGAPT